MRVTAQPAYILHARAWRETSLLLEAFTRDHGRVGLVARGVRSARARLPRSALEPLQALQLDWSGRGELQTLTAAEPVRNPPALRGDALMSAMYVNELMVRLTARDDPHPELFQRYAGLLDELAAAQSLAWTLRRFERDLLQATGYGLQLLHEADTGEAVEADAWYRYGAEEGARRCGADTARALRGDDLLALAHDRMPDARGLKALRDLMREVIRFHLGGGELRAWRVLSMAGSRRAGPHTPSA